MAKLVNGLSMIPCISKDEKLDFDMHMNKYLCAWYFMVAWNDRLS